MEIKDIILTSLGESRDYLNRAVDGLSPTEFVYAPGPECNSIAFIFWHVVRVEDLWINRTFLKVDEIYESGGWREKLGTPANEDGFNYNAEQISAWPVPSLDVLNEYAEAVRDKTVSYIQMLSPKQLDEEIDFFGRSRPLGYYLAHVITEIAMHVGQISYIRGILRGIEPSPLPDTD